MNDETTSSNDNTVKCLVNEVSQLRAALVDRDEIITKLKASEDAARKLAHKDGFVDGVNATLDRFLPKQSYNEPFLPRTITVGPAPSDRDGD